MFDREVDFPLLEAVNIGLRRTLELVRSWYLLSTSVETALMTEEPSQSPGVRARQTWAGRDEKEEIQRRNLGRLYKTVDS